MIRRPIRLTLVALCFLSLTFPQFVFAQKQSTPKPFDLTVDSIMRGPRLVGYPPTGVYWSQDSQRVYFRWQQHDQPRLKETSLHVRNRDGPGLSRLSAEEVKNGAPEHRESSEDKSVSVFSGAGEVLIY